MRGVRAHYGLSRKRVQHLAQLNLALRVKVRFGLFQETHRMRTESSTVTSNTAVV